MIYLLIGGCASGKAGSGKIITGPAAKDLVEYINQGILRINALERRAVESYAAVIGENYTTDEKVYEALKNVVIPTYKRFLDELSNITTQNEEVRNLHRIYVGAAELTYDGFKTKMMGIENNNMSIVDAGNEKIEKGRDEIIRWDQERIELFKKHGVAEIKDE
jgi:hypothetical protein